MNLDRFQNSPTGRVIKAWQAQPPYWAFVPNPLPPQIDFDHSLVSVLSQADRALGELAGLEGRVFVARDSLRTVAGTT